MLSTRTAQVTLDVDATTMNKLGLASNAMSEQASAIVAGYDNVKRRATRR